MLSCWCEWEVRSRTHWWGATSAQPSCCILFSYHGVLQQKNSEKYTLLYKIAAGACSGLNCPINPLAHCNASSSVPTDHWPVQIRHSTHFVRIYATFMFIFPFFYDPGHQTVLWALLQCALPFVYFVLFCTSFIGPRGTLVFLLQTVAPIARVTPTYTSLHYVSSGCLPGRV